MRGRGIRGDIRPHGEGTVNISAKTGEGLPELLEAIDKTLDKGSRRVTLHLPYGPMIH